MLLKIINGVLYKYELFIRSSANVDFILRYFYHEHINNNSKIISFKN